MLRKFSEKGKGQPESDFDSHPVKIKFLCESVVENDFLARKKSFFRRERTHPCVLRRASRRKSLRLKLKLS